MIYKSYNSEQYLHELNARIKECGKGDNIALVSMSFNPDDKKIKQLVRNLCSAAKRGSSVVLVVDAFSFLSGDRVWPGPLFFNPSLKGNLPVKYHRKLDSLNELRSCGGKYVITNMPERRLTLPFKGRSHIKLGMINDTNYLGSFNLDSSATTDIMVEFENSSVAKHLRDLITKLGSQPNVKDVLGGEDKVIPVDKSTKIIIDAGTKNQSTILREAYKLIDSAKGEILFTCQYFPNGNTIKKLVNAQNRGVKVTLIYNTPFARKFPRSLPHYFLKSYYRLKIPSAFFKNQVGLDQPFLHSKILVADGSAIIGSHNMIEAGVNFGTAEIALSTQDEAIISILIN